MRGIHVLAIDLLDSRSYPESYISLLQSARIW